jgi:hypothetical protein
MSTTFLKTFAQLFYLQPRAGNSRLSPFAQASVEPAQTLLARQRGAGGDPPRHFRGRREVSQAPTTVDVEGNPDSYSTGARCARYAAATLERA